MMSSDAHALGEQEVAEAERRAALRLEDVADLPAAEERVRGAGPVGAEATLAAERQLDETARDERVRAIEVADDALELGVGVVEVPGLDHRPRPAVGDLHGEAVRHAPLDARLERVVVGPAVRLGRLNAT